MPVTIRSRLTLLVLFVLLPAAIGVVWLVGRTFVAERESHVRMLRETARAMSLLVDRELAGRAAMAQVLAQSSRLDGKPLPRPTRSRSSRCRRGARWQDWTAGSSCADRASCCSTPAVHPTSPAPPGRSHACSTAR
ncbi:hypothetical protein ABXN37_26995 [Piscinibacter sakaiensis]|uniref:hypothetical protein n=1 Tax=Piscinibacter sakaiensis TaxID=1547922 RepID=UPI0006B59C74|nr:hypothetical protein [Piscinibacter sakaiensis]